MSSLLKKRKKTCAAAAVGIVGFVLPCHWGPVAALLSATGAGSTFAAMHSTVLGCFDPEVEGDAEAAESTLNPETLQFWEDRISGRITPEDDLEHDPDQELS